MKHYETSRAIFDGAREIDMVINIGALKSGDLHVVERDIEAVVAPCRDAGVAQQGDHRGGAADRRGEGDGVHAVEGGGRGLREDVHRVRPGRRHRGRRRVDARVVGAEMGVKAAGGVKDYAALKQMVAAGATRVGASAGVRIVQESRGGRPAAAMPSGY